MSVPLGANITNSHRSEHRGHLLDGIAVPHHETHDAKSFRSQVPVQPFTIAPILYTRKGTKGWRCGALVPAEGIHHIDRRGTQQHDKQGWQDEDDHRHGQHRRQTRSFFFGAGQTLSTPFGR